MEVDMNVIPDWRLYELESFSWDEVATGDDHIVLQQAREQMIECTNRSFDGCLNDFIEDSDSNILSGDPIIGNIISLDGSRNGVLSINDPSLAVADLDFWENGNKDSGIDRISDDLLNFEDVDGLFRNCDATFRKEHACKVDDLSWFASSSNNVYGSEITLQPGLRSFSELCELNNKSDHDAEFFMPKSDQPLTICGNPFSHVYQSCVGCLDTKANYKAEQKEHVNDMVDGIKIPSITRTKGRNVLNACKDTEMINLRLKTVEPQCSSKEKWYTDKKLSPSASTQVYCSQDSTKQEHFVGSASCTHTSNLHPQLEHCRTMHQITSPQATSSTTFDKITTSAYVVSDSITGHASQWMDILPYQMSNPSTTRPNKKLKVIHSEDELCATMIAEDRHQQDYFESITAHQRKNQEYSQKIGESDKIKSISLENAVDIDSPLVFENSCMLSASPDDISIEAISFQQLQYVMDQMDIRTNLCIRDSLYRLSRSAKERVDAADRNGCGRERKRFAGFMDAEAISNPIDKSIAHLLFLGLLQPASKPVW